MALEIQSDEQNSGQQSVTTLAEELIALIGSKLPGSETETYYSVFRKSFVVFALDTLSIADSQDERSIANVIQVMQSIILPTVYSNDQGQKDYPFVTAEGTELYSVNGLLVSTFVGLFDYVFRDRCQVGDQTLAPVEDIVNRLDDLNWREDEALKKQLMCDLCSNTQICDLFYYGLASSVQLRYCLALTIVDPCLAYLFLQWGIETIPQNASFFTTCKLDDLVSSDKLPFAPASGSTAFTVNTTEAGYVKMWKNFAAGAVTAVSASEASGSAANSNTQVSGSLNTQSDTLAKEGFAKYSFYAVALRDAWIHSITKPGSPLEAYRNAWRNRLFGKPNSHLATLVKINEEYNLNVNKKYDLGEVEGRLNQFHLGLGQQYQKVLNANGFSYLDLKEGCEIPLPDQPILETTSGGPSIEIDGIKSGGGGGGGGGGGAAAETAPVVPQPTLSDSGLAKGENGSIKNTFSGPQIIANSGRIVLNANDHLMLFGEVGTTISSKQRINIDTNDTITLFGEQGLYLGLPNKGVPIEKKRIAGETSKFLPAGQLFEAGPTADNESGYEPLVLGDKLANFLDDLIFCLINATTLNPVGDGGWREDTTYHLQILQQRVPEMLSTYAYIDGISHEEARTPFPTPPATLSTSGGTFDPNSEGGQMIRRAQAAAEAAMRAAEEAARLAQEGAAARNDDPLASYANYYEPAVVYPTDQWQ